MKSLELMVPPPLVAALAAILAWGLSQVRPGAQLHFPGSSALVLALSLLGLVIGMLGLGQFLSVGTSVNPHRPTRARVLVADGIYRFTRNPMYLGMALLLLAWCLHLGGIWSLITLPLFIWYLTRFQIIPEEKILAERFGADFQKFSRRTRRWL